MQKYMVGNNFFPWAISNKFEKGINDRIKNTLFKSDLNHQFIFLNI